MANENYPYEIKVVELEGTTHKLPVIVRIGPKGYVIHEKFKHAAADVYNMEVRSSDVFVASFPRSGTTLTQDIVWLIVSDLDYERALNIPLTERYAFFEFFSSFDDGIKMNLLDANKDDEAKIKEIELIFKPATEILETTPSPRFIKTHLPLSLMPRKALEAKVVYVARDPRDTIVSLYLLVNSMRHMKLEDDFKTFWNTFVNNLRHYLHRLKLKTSPACDCDDRTDQSVVHLLVDCANFERARCDLELETGTRLSRDGLSDMLLEHRSQLEKFCDKIVRYVTHKNSTREPWTPYFDHVKEAWEKRDHPNMLFLFYEDMRKDLPSVVRRVSDFFGKKYNEEEIARLCDHLSFENFKKNPSVNYDLMKELGFMYADREFIRKGKSGGWRDYFDEEMTAEADKWIEENLRDTDLCFPSMQ